MHMGTRLLVAAAALHQLVVVEMDNGEMASTLLDLPTHAWSESFLA